jgi:glyoxylase I family protein
MAAWYVAHLGLTVKRAHAVSPFGHFLADSGDHVMIEIYNNPAVPVPDYRSFDPVVVHLAFATDDVTGTRARLMAAGASPVGEIQTSPAGDELAMLRDPWGFAVQLAKRAEPMI